MINYESSLRVHTFEKWEKVRINSITTSQIRDLIVDDLSKYSESHKKSMLKYIKAVFQFSLEAGIVQRDPSPKIKFIINEKIKKALVEDEVKLFLREAQRRSNPWFPIWVSDKLVMQPVS